jgi:universal stress protein A
VISPKLSQILVPTDFSGSSDAALQYGKMLAERFGASLHLLHVIEQPAFAGGLDIYAMELPRMLEAAQKEAEARLDQYLTAAERERLSASAEIADGHTARTIVDVARRRGADLIVMGTHGRGGMAHLLLGSVAEKVIRMASCPVLTVRTTDQESETRRSHG